jgi:hypothetical protein
MSARTIKILAIAVVLLFAAVFLLNRQRSTGADTDELLFPDLEEQLDAVTEVTVTDADGKFVILREGDGWRVPDKGGYPANTGALRDLLVGIAEARKIEQKTSDSAFYDRLGVQAPEEEGSTGTLVESTGPGAAAFSLILGDPVQREFRYVRVPDEAQSWLIDRNPEVPEDAAGWLASGIVNIPASRIRTVSITHEDGETLRLHKEDEDAANFTIEGIPEGRQLSYPSVGNSVAAALEELALEDVRRAEVGETGGKTSGDSASATAVFTTFDGLQLTVDSTTAEDDTWISLHAGTVPVDAAESAAVQETPVASPADTVEQPVAETADAPQTEAAELPDPAEQAEALNARVSGWEYRIPQYKASQLTRRWEDLLADPETAAE